MSTERVIVACSLSTQEARSERGAEVLTAARQLAAPIHGQVVWLVAGEPAADLGEIGGRFGAVRVEILPVGHDADEVALVAALASCVGASGARAAVSVQTFEARTVVPRVAARLRSPVLMNVLKASVSGSGLFTATARAFGGDTHATYDFVGDGPYFLSLLPRAVTPIPIEGPQHPVPVTERAALPHDGGDGIRVVRPPTQQGSRLEDATIVVAGGRGLGERSRYQLIEALADALGGVAAASRPLVDDGWVDASRQVGLTGTVVQPDLYIAVGISGASQHMAGCSAARVIVAINSDENAAIFRYARFGVVADAASFLPLLIDAVIVP